MSQFLDHNSELVLLLVNTLLSDLKVRKADGRMLTVQTRASLGTCCLDCPPCTLEIGALKMPESRT
jgi:hypothetical protein